MMPTERPTSRATSRIVSRTRECQEWSECEKVEPQHVAPAVISPWSFSWVTQAGPTVHTILVFRSWRVRRSGFSLRP